jgi:capsid protein
MTNGSIIPQLKPGERIESVTGLHPNTNMTVFLEYSPGTSP